VLQNYTPESNDYKIITEFQVTVIHPCVDTVLNEFSISPSKIELKLLESMEMQISEPTDTISFTKGLQDGYTFCGDRLLYLINNLTGDKSYLSSSKIFVYKWSMLTITPIEVGTFSYSLGF